MQYKNKLKIALAVVFLTVVSAQAETNVVAKNEKVSVDGGSSKYSIYYSSNAPKSVQMAALDLQEYIYKACGTKLLIVNEPKSPMISLGDNPASRAAGLAIADIPLEGFRIETKSGNLYILGPDTADGKRTAGDGSSAGTRNGVYYFLEQFIGVRWLMPGEHGDYIPHLAGLEIPRICLTNAPFFLYRYIPYSQDGRPEVKIWKIRQKTGSSLNINCGEAWEYIVTPDMFKQHPEWFAERGGVPTPPDKLREYTYKLCISRDEVVQFFADAAISCFDKDPNRLSFSISPSDSGANWCECAKCKMMYEKDPNGQLSVTPAVLTFYNKVAKLVAKKYPNKLLGGYVYQTYQFPPATPIKMEPNVFLTWAAEFDYGFTLYRPKIREQWQQSIAQWTQVQTNLSYYDLPNLICNNRSCAPNPPGLKILKFIYPRLKQFHISGVYIYGCSDWGHGALVNYLLAKLAWNPDADPEMIFNEFCEKAYGAGAEEIKQFYRLLDDETERFFMTNNKESAGDEKWLKDVYARNFSKLEQLYLAAQNKVDDPEAKVRLNMLGKALTVLHWSLRQLNMAENPASSRFYLDNAAFHEFIKANTNSLYISITDVLAGVRRKLTVALITNVPNAEATTPYLLRDNQHLVIYPTNNSVRIGMIDLERHAVNPGAAVCYVVYNAEGEEVLRGVFNPDVVFSITPADSPYYHLMITAGNASYRMNIQGAAWAIDGRIAANGFEFLQQATPLYFEVPENLNSFSLQMTTDAPGESALAVLYTPAGKEAARFNCTVTPVDHQNISVGSSDSGIWKLVIKKAETGVLDDVFIKPGDEIPGYFSILPDKVLKIRAVK